MQIHYVDFKVPFSVSFVGTVWTKIWFFSSMSEDVPAKVSRTAEDSATCRTSMPSHRQPRISALQ